MKLLQTLNDLVKEKDPIERVFMEMGSRMTQLKNDQVYQLVLWMHDTISEGAAESPDEAARMALENVAGFETADETTIDNTVEMLVARYNQEYHKE